MTLDVFNLIAPVYLGSILSALGTEIYFDGKETLDEHRRRRSKSLHSYFKSDLEACSYGCQQNLFFKLCRAVFLLPLQLVFLPWKLITFPIACIIVYTHKDKYKKN